MKTSYILPPFTESEFKCIMVALTMANKDKKEALRKLLDFSGPTTRWVPPTEIEFDETYQKIMSKIEIKGELSGKSKSRTGNNSYEPSGDGSDLRLF